MYVHTHKVSYFETDKMGITHHSNYIRWMEDARVAFLESIGTPYEKFEELGVISPVIYINSEYKNTTTFADLIDIEIWIKKYNGVKLEIEYNMKKHGTDIVVCKASSGHCFLVDGKVAILGKTHPELHALLMQNT